MPKVPSPPNGLSDEHPLPPDCAAKYAVQRRLGEGGFGVVYLASHRELKRPVAIKILLSEILSQSEQVQRFQAEAQIAAAVDHPNVVRVMDYGAAVGIPWIAFQFVPGRSVRALVDAGPLPWRQAVKIACQVLEGLHAAHSRGILHRDVKPDNVLQTEEGNFLVSDFGIAKWGESGVRTRTGLVLGTPCYLAPEQARGELASPATDLYAVAVMLFELLAGKPPYDDASPLRVLEQHLNAPIPKLSERRPGLPRALDGVLERGLAKAPKDRAASARELADELANLLHQPTGISSRIPVPIARSGAAQDKVPVANGAPARARTGLIAGILLTAGALVAAVAWQARMPPGPPDPVPEVTPNQRLADQVAALETAWLRTHDGARLDELEALLDAAPVIEAPIRLAPTLADAFVLRLRQPLDRMISLVEAVDSLRATADDPGDILTGGLSTIDHRRKFASDLRTVNPKLRDDLLAMVRPLTRLARIHTRAALGLELAIKDQIPLTIYTAQMLRVLHDFKALKFEDLEAWVARVREGRPRDWRIPYLEGGLHRLAERDGAQIEAFIECVRLLRAHHGATMSAKERTWLTHDIMDTVLSGFRARPGHDAERAEMLVFVNEVPQPRSPDTLQRMAKFKSGLANVAPRTFDPSSPRR